MTITGQFPKGMTSSSFLITGTSSTGSIKTISVPMLKCEISNCESCSSSSVCDACSAFARIDGYKCTCLSKHCKVCVNSECDECEENYSLHIDKYCISDDPFIATYSLLIQIAVGVSMATSFAANMLASSASISKIFSLFNTLQIIQIAALIDLEYPPKLDQFYHGFKFTLLNTPPELNFVNILFITPGSDEPFSERMESFGFTSSYILVQQVAVFTLCFVFLSSLGIV